MVNNIEDSAADWESTLNLELTAKINADEFGIMIGQIPCGEAVMELVQPANPDSPLASRIIEQGEHAGSMVAIEVEDIDKEISRYRDAGYTVSEKPGGPIPGTTKRALIPADEAFGLEIQLLTYR
jgi:hypothetical protein